MNKLLITLALTLFSLTANSLELTPENTVNIREEISDSSTEKAFRDLDRLSKKRGKEDYPIYIVLNSPGGSVMAGLSFIKYARTIKNVKTICIFCASMAHAIIQHLDGERLILEDSILMAHRAKGTFRGQFADGELESQLKVYSKLITHMEQKTANRIGIPLTEYKKRIKDEWWSFGAEALQENVADRVITINCSKELTNTVEISEEQSFFGTIKTYYSACPLIEYELERPKSNNQSKEPTWI